MKNKTKWLVGALVVVLLVGAGVVLANPELYKGMIRFQPRVAPVQETVRVAPVQETVRIPVSRPALEETVKEPEVDRVPPDVTRISIDDMSPGELGIPLWELDELGLRMTPGDLMDIGVNIEGTFLEYFSREMGGILGDFGREGGGILAGFSSGKGKGFVATAFDSKGTMGPAVVSSGDTEIDPIYITPGDEDGEGSKLPPEAQESVDAVRESLQESPLLALKSGPPDDDESTQATPFEDIIHPTTGRSNFLAPLVLNDALTRWLTEQDEGDDITVAIVFFDPLGRQVNEGIVLSGPLAGILAIQQQFTDPTKF